MDDSGQHGSQLAPLQQSLCQLLPEYLAVVYNNQLVYDQNVKQIFNSAENTITLPLPYVAGERNIPPFEGNIVEKLASTKVYIIKEGVKKE